jgi:hypothetical protein
MERLGMDPEMARIRGFDVGGGGEAEEAEAEEAEEEEEEEEAEEGAAEEEEAATRKGEKAGAEVASTAGGTRQLWERVLSPRLSKAYDQLLGAGEWAPSAVISTVSVWAPSAVISPDPYIH